MLPGPIVGWACAAAVGHRELESIRLPTPSGPQPEFYTPFARPIVIQELGITLGAIGFVVVFLSWCQSQTLRHAKAEEEARQGPWI